MNYLKTFYNNRWHLHSLTFVICYLMLWYIKFHPSFMDLGYSSKFLQGFLSVFCSFSAGFIVEWIQGAFFGANRLPNERKASNLDMLVSTLAGTIGMIVFFIFN